MVPKMILRLDFVDLVDHVASSILVRHVALSEFIHTAFSMQAASSVLQRTIACDGVCVKNTWCAE